ncbi:MliC family protein [Devosia sp. XJ19-1]|uniref:MliC family protein n=1 Tax=Devosia ureilytica TaxID=2952754 RepID=A0A9Q4FSW3_9HYPH|nr:MliC family protein [Devosia ureilytica]MCP8883697.1 MliC family protein [Devosia ureilytica]MCP8887305.1 MliC family protein [Devosia ureilytica]
MIKPPLSLAALPLLALTLPGIAQAQSEAALPTPTTASAALTLTLESQGDIERRIVVYQCDGDLTLSVQYVNAAPNFLAILPVEGQSLVFATTLSASGARYVAGPYEWWSHQGEATLRDLTQDEDADPLATCAETSNTP